MDIEFKATKGELLKLIENIEHRDIIKNLSEEEFNSLLNSIADALEREFLNIPEDYISADLFLIKRGLQ